MDPIGQLKRYLTDFAANLSPLGAQLPLSGTILSRANEGSLFLDREEQAALRQMTLLMYRHYGRDQALSRRAVEQALQEALFVVADNKGTRGGTPDERVKLAAG